MTHQVQIEDKGNCIPLSLKEEALKLLHIFAKSYGGMTEEKRVKEAGETKEEEALKILYAFAMKCYMTEEEKVKEAWETKEKIKQIYGYKRAQIQRLSEVTDTVEAMNGLEEQELKQTPHPESQSLKDGAGSPPQQTEDFHFSDDVNCQALADMIEKHLSLNKF